MSEDEKDGMKRILKIREDKEAVVMKIDKFGKFTIATLDKYIEMGMEHVGDDKEVGREKIREMGTAVHGGRCLVQVRITTTWPEL